MGLVFVFVLLLWAWVGERVVCLLRWFLFGFVLGGLGFFALWLFLFCMVFVAVEPEI